MNSPSCEQDVTRCVEVLQSGGVILYPTDTIWGLGCDATLPAAVNAISRIKKRLPEKGFITLVDGEEMLMKYIPPLPYSILEFIRGYSSPLTVIYSGASGLAPNVFAPDGTAAIRIVKDDFCCEMISRFGKPVVSTSANESGQPVPESFGKIDEKTVSAVTYAVMHMRDEIIESKPSSIFGFDEKGNLFKRR